MTPEVDPINLYNVDQAFDRATQVNIKTLGDYVNAKGGMKFDQEKPRFGLLPPKALTEVAKVLTYGARKYSADNWRKVEMDRYFDACQRHLWAYKDGQVLDKESGMNHLAHAICSLLFILEMDLAQGPKDQENSGP